MPPSEVITSSCVFQPLRTASSGESPVANFCNCQRTRRALKAFAMVSSPCFSDVMRGPSQSIPCQEKGQDAVSRYSLTYEHTVCS